MPTSNNSREDESERVCHYTNLIALQASDHELGEDDHTGTTHPGAAVHHHGGVEALGGVQHGVGVSPD